jgi:hypothetical protein
MVGRKLHLNVVGRGLALAKGANKGHKYPFAPFICTLRLLLTTTFTPLNIEPWLIMPIAATWQAPPATLPNASEL